MFASCFAASSAAEYIHVCVCVCVCVCLGMCFCLCICPPAADWPSHPKQQQQIRNQEASEDKP